ncbi:aprataxin isoform X2 [Brachionus plicatilis]|uniref:Aprataxin isoform X2 n=1 Tax=Brachionus plicatilis TaxID=10195 RepID=A0A3M7QAK7_BRAPC|nr:aprataxin isoform X2 [Brachionus plicatilis]
MKRLQSNSTKGIGKLTSDKAKSVLNDETVKSSIKKSAPFLSLESSMKDEKLQVFKNDRFICIQDKYPKAKVHFLLIPHGNELPKMIRVADLIKSNQCLDLLKEIKSLSEKIIAENFPKELKSKTMCGFHSIQSMQPLHMHIISKDFDSDCLKNKKHWNSFNTKYFINLDDLIECLKNEKDYFKNDFFNLNNQKILKDYLDCPLKCNVCNAVQKNMPSLKRHLVTHK